MKRIKSSPALTVISLCLIVAVVVTVGTITAFMQEKDKPSSGVQATEAQRIDLEALRKSAQSKENQSKPPIQTGVVPLVAASNNYSFTTATNASLTDMSGGTTQLVAADLDDSQSSTAPSIGFDFFLMGIRYTQFSASSNGMVGLGSTIVGSGTYTVSSGTTTTPIISAFGGDLRTGSSGKVHYKVTGSAPSRVLIIEFLNMSLLYVASPGSNDGTYQVRLYETSGKMEFVYGSMTRNSGTTAFNSQQVGIGFATNTTTNNFLNIISATNSSNTTNPFAQQTYATGAIANLNSAADGSRRIYTLTAPTPSAPTAPTFTSVGSTSMTLNWTDNSGNEAGFPIYRSTDGGTTYTFFGQAAENATSFNATGLSPSTTYFWQVYAVSEGALSSALTGSQATNATATITSTGTGGNWSATGTWVGGVVPTASDNAVIADGATVTIDTTASCLNLTVGQGASGILQFEQTTARTITVASNVTIASGGTFRSSTAGTQTGHSLSIGGDLTNNGTLDLSTTGTSANSCAAGITFTGSANNTFSGTGATTDLRTLTINKGTSSASTLEITTSNLTVQGTSTDGTPMAFLTLTNGTLKISGTFTIAGRVFTATAYTIGATTGFWLNNPNFTVSGQNGSPTNNGLLRVSQGTFNAGSSSGNAMGAGAGATFTVEGGTINFSGRLNTSSAVTYTQSSGTVNVCTVGNGSASTFSFGLTSASTVFTMSGGTINLVQINSTGTAANRTDYQVSGTASITGGTLNIGTSATTGNAGNFDFRIRGQVPNLVLNNTTNNKNALLLAQTNVFGSTTISLGTTLNLSGFLFLQIGTTLTNNGTIDGTTASSTLYFQGSAAQTSTGTGAVTTPLQALTLDNPLGVTLGSGITAFTTLRVNLFDGTLTNSNKITLGNGGATSAVTQIGATGLVIPGGNYDVAPTFNPGTGGNQIIYQQESVARTTSVEIPSGRSLANLTIANSNGVTLAGGGLTITGASGFALTSGTLNTTSSNLLTLASTVTTTPAGSTTSFVNGPLAIQIPTTAAISRTFAVGKGSAFRPVTLSNMTLGSQQTVTAEVFNSASGGTPVSPLLTLDAARYWQLSNSAGLNASTKVQLTYNTDDNVFDTTNARVAQSGTLSGSYSSLGGTVTGNTSSGTIVSTANLTPGSDFFTIGNQNTAPIAWDGGASTSNWGDAANWSNDTVPDGTMNVSLSFGSATTINVNGTFSTKDLAVGTNTTLNFGTGTLNVTGNFTQSAGTININTGSLNVTGTSSLTGGTTNINSGTYLATGAFTLNGGTLTNGTGGTLNCKADFTLTSGSFSVTVGATGSTNTFSGTATQNITIFSGGNTFNNMILQGGGAGAPKNFTAGRTPTISNDFTVATTAQLALSAATATTFNVAGNFNYGGVTGGTNIGSLTINLTGSGKTINSSALAAPIGGQPPSPDYTKIKTTTFDMFTDVGRYLKDHPDARKGEVPLENTFEKKKAEVAKLLAEKDPQDRLVINLDDATIVQNPASFSKLAPASAPAFEMAVTVASAASYTLADNVSIASGKTLTVIGRLNADTFTIGGAGNVTVTGSTTVGDGVLGTATASASGLGATVINSGTSSYTDAIIEYNASGTQTINAANHPAAAMIYTAGSGTKTLSANKTISGNSSSALTKAALFVGSGSTFADGGFIVDFTTSSFANVIVNGTYLSTGSGGLTWQSGPFQSNVQAVTGTQFGDLTMNFSTSTNDIEMNASGTVSISFRNIACGGTAGGTLLLNETGTTNVTVFGNVNINPSTVTNTGGGFGGTSSTTGTVTVKGNITTTSTNATQPIFNSTGTNTLIMGGTSAQTITLGASSTIFTGSKLQIDNTTGVSFGTTPVQIGTGGSLVVNGRFDCGTKIVAGAGAFTLASGGTLGIGDPSGITSSGASGNIQVTGARSFNTGANYIYNGSAAQVTGNGLPATVNNLTISNAAGVALTSSTAVNGTLTLTSGTLAVGTNTLTLNSAVSVTSGTLSSSASGTVSYNQSSNGQNVLAATYGNLTFSNFNKTLASTGTIGVAGTFTPGSATGHTITGSTIDFTGSGSQTIPAFNYNNLSSSGSGGRTLASSGTIGIKTTFSPGSQAYTVTGSTVDFNGSGGQTGPSVAFSYNNLTVSDSGGLTFAASQTVNGTLDLAGGDITTTSSFTLFQGGGSSSGAFDVVGNVNRGDVAAGSTKSFGNVNVQITQGTGTTGNDITVTLAKSAPNDFTNAVTRTYDITKNSGTLVPVGSIVRLRYKISPDELNGNMESALELWRRDGSTYTALGGTPDLTNHHVTYSFLVTDHFSRWAISDADAPTDVAMMNAKATRYDKHVLLEWQTGYEVSNIGFNIYREKNGNLERITPEPVAGSALIAGPRVELKAGLAYSWWDDEEIAECGMRNAECENRRYWIEDLDLSGKTTTHGPFGVSDAAADDPLADQHRDQAMILTHRSRLLSALGRDASLAQTAEAVTVPVEPVAKVTKLTAARMSIQSGVASQPAVKMSIQRAGWYRVEQADLVAAGLPGSADPTMLQLFADGREVPMLITAATASGGVGVGPGGVKTNAWNGIEFYGVGIDSPSTVNHVYWLVVGGQPGLRIGNSSAKGGPPAPSSFAYTVERRDRSLYFPALKNGGAEKWFGPLIYNAQPVDQSVTLQHVTAPGSATMLVSLQGFTSTAHSVRVLFNNVEVGTMNFSGQQKSSQKFVIPASNVREGVNQIQLIGPAGTSDMSLVDFVQVTYAHSMTADTNALRIPVSGQQSVTVDGFTSSAIRVMDVTDASSPVELQTTVNSSATSKTSSTYSVTATASGSGTRVLLAFASDQQKRPAQIAANQPSSYRDPSQRADYLVLTRKDLMGSFDVLAELRKSQGLAPLVIDVEDIYDEFNFGNKSPHAIKDFLSYAKTSWARAPRFVVLGGDATYDPKNYLGTGDFDLVPTRLVETAYNEAATDDWFVDVNGDAVPDMAIGRLPVRTASEAAALVLKLVSYDSSAASNNVLLVADRNSSFDFEGADTQLRTLIPASMTVTDIRRGQVGDANARSQLLAALNQGARVVNFYGHGSTTVWTDAPILSASDAAGLTNRDQLSLVVSMTCLNAYFVTSSIESLGESLLKSQGGAIAVWASSGLTDANAQTVMSRDAISRLFSGSNLTIGEVVALSKASVTNMDVRRTWILLGDPATRLRVQGPSKKE